MRAAEYKEVTVPTGSSKAPQACVHAHMCKQLAGCRRALTGQLLSCHILRAATRLSDTPLWQPHGATEAQGPQQTPMGTSL